MSTEILETSPLYRRWVDDTMREAARVALLGRWGELPEDVAAAVEAASRETLLDVIAHVAADTAEELRARLGM